MTYLKPGSIIRSVIDHSRVFLIVKTEQAKRTNLPDYYFYVAINIKNQIQETLATAWQFWDVIVDYKVDIKSDSK